ARLRVLRAAQRTVRSEKLRDARACRDRWESRFYSCHAQMFRRASKQVAPKSADDPPGTPAFPPSCLPANCESPLAEMKAGRAAIAHSLRARRRLIWPVRESPSRARQQPRAKSPPADAASLRSDVPKMFVQFVCAAIARRKSFQGREAAPLAGPCAAIRPPRV